MHPGIWTRVSRRATNNNNNNNQNTGKKQQMIDETHYIVWLIQSSAVFIRPKCSLQMLKMTTSFIFETILCIILLKSERISYRIIWNFSHHFVEFFDEFYSLEIWWVNLHSHLKKSRMPTHDFWMNCHELRTQKGSLFMTIYILVNQSMDLDYKWLHGENTLEQAPRIPWYDWYQCRIKEYHFLMNYEYQVAISYWMPVAENRKIWKLSAETVYYSWRNRFQT